MITALADGTVEFRVFLPHASSVELVGDFTEWRGRPVKMSREHPGWWSVRVKLHNGDHQFCYLVDGNIWLADYAAHGVHMNQYGGWVSRIAVDAHRVELKPELSGVSASAA